MRSLTVICPVQNEAPSIEYFYNRITPVLARFSDDVSYEILFINNASTDATLPEIMALRAKDPRVQVISQARNFGYQASVICGVREASADAYVVIDVDCEDPPEMIADFIKHWFDGYDLVYGVRGGRPEPGWLTALRKLFYRLTHLIADWDFIVDMAEFSLFTDRIKHEIVRSRSTAPFVRADLAYVGLRRIGIPYARESRRFGRSHYNLLRMTKFAISGILSSSTFPLRAAAYIGVPMAAIDFIAALVALVFGWANPTSLLLLNAAYIVAALTFLSIYLARVYKDGIARPVYIVDWRNSHLNRARPERPLEVGLDRAGSAAPRA